MDFVDNSLQNELTLIDIFINIINIYYIID